MCMFVYIYIYIHTHIYLCVCMHVCVCLCVCIWRERDSKELTHMIIEEKSHMCCLQDGGPESQRKQSQSKPEGVKTTEAQGASPSLSRRRPMFYPEQSDREGILSSSALLFYVRLQWWMRPIHTGKGRLPHSGY